VKNESVPEIVCWSEDGHAAHPVTSPYQRIHPSRWRWLVVPAPILWTIQKEKIAGLG